MTAVANRALLFTANKCKANVTLKDGKYTDILTEKIFVAFAIKHHYMQKKNKKKNNIIFVVKKHSSVET